MTDLTIREARADDLEAIIRLHEEDEPGFARRSVVGGDAAGL